VSLTFVGAELQAQDTNAVSATMLRVLAEAADVDRTGKPVYLVADYRFPHTVIGHVSSRREAERLRADSGSTFGIFGPYTTPADPAPADTASRVVAVTLTWQTPRGRVDRKLDPKVDALFLTQSAVDKFVTPYYERIYGPAYSEKLARLGPMPPMPMPGCHKGSVKCWPKPDGSLEMFRGIDPTAQPREMNPTVQPPR
jgi:hypothetical protein